MPQTDHWGNKTLHFLLPHLESTNTLLQVATGYFSIQGFDLIRETVRKIPVHIMVGYDEQSREAIRQMLIAEIMQDLRCWPIKNRRAAVEDLVRRMQGGNFRLSEGALEAKTKKRDHAKLYISDSKKVLSGSANLSINGLWRNTENLTVVNVPHRAKTYIDGFLSSWNDKDTADLTQLLLEALLKWLELYRPFDIYLKTVQSFIKEDNLRPSRANYKMPVKYQKVVIERVIRQLRKYHGAMLVASTGLGKTIMATHTAFRLAQNHEIDNVLIFAPKSVHPDWDLNMHNAALRSKSFTPDILDKASRQGSLTRKMLESLERVDEKCLIIIDESQYFRNRNKAQGKGERTSFKRLLKVVKNQKPKVLLLTATPYATEMDNLNNQLLLIPHTDKSKNYDTKGQYFMPGIADDIVPPEAWRINHGQSFFSEFINLPVATVLSTSQVAKTFATKTQDGDYLMFGEKKMWLPRIAVRKVQAPVFMENEISEIIQKKVFNHEKSDFINRDGKFIRTYHNLEREATLSWLSSPAALLDVLIKTVEGGYKYQFTTSSENRADLLNPIIEKIKEKRFEEDPKIMALVEILKGSQATGQKVIVFTERLYTALYLEDALAELLPFFKVANTITRGRDGIPKAKNFESEVFDLVKAFAPIANSDKILKEEQLPHYDVFILTDANSTGVNLQDASCVIHYDLAWTPDILIQRAGRILRFWHEPREIQYYIFSGVFEKDEIGKKKSVKIDKRLKKLTQRIKTAEKFSGIPLIPESETANYASLGNIPNVIIEDLGYADIEELEEFSGASDYLKHIAAVQEHEEYLQHLPDDITSARLYSGNSKMIYLHLRHEEEYFHILFDLERGCIIPKKDDDLLALLRCSPDTPTAEVSLDLVEIYAQNARKFWEQKNASNTIDIEKVERIGALLFLPSSASLDIQDLIEQAFES